MAKPNSRSELDRAETPAAALERTAVRRLSRKGTAIDEIAALAEESAIALVYNGTSHAVMMATPADLEDFALGFSLSEGIAETRREIGEIEIHRQPQGIELRIELAQSAFWRLKERRRTLAGRTGCGLCGVESLDYALPALRPIAGDFRLPLDRLYRALDDLPLWQRANRETHALHAAAFADAEGRILIAREDIGRHNALDKLIGALAKDGLSPATGFLLITSRCSVEMAAKAIRAGAPILAALSAPTALARRMALENNLTLIALARPDSLMILTYPERIRAE